MRVLIPVLTAVALLLAGCAAPPAAGNAEVARLASELSALGPEVDPEEAARAAQIAYSHTHELAQAYQITDPPLVHNTKVNAGIKPRGLCWHWAEDMQKRFDAEGFRTLQTHRAIANADNPFRIDHSTTILSARGATMTDGIVIDPWREGGRLFWATLRDDSRYDWRPQSEVLARKYGPAGAGVVVSASSPPSPPAHR